MKPTLQTNIPALYLIKLSKWFMLIMPVVALFYTDNGLDDLDIYLLQAVYSLSVALLEIPSGYFADVLGRKKTLVFGSVLGTLGFVVYSVSQDFQGFLWAEIILGLGGSFISGSDSAMLYDSLDGMGRRHDYLRMEGRITALGSFAETSAAIGGGLLAVYFGYRSVYICQIGIAAIAIPASLLLVEPIQATSIERPGLRHIIQVCRESILTNRRLSATLLMSSIAGTATLCMAWTAQIYFVSMGLTEKLITPLWVLLNFIVALSSAFAASVTTWFGRDRALIFLAVMLPLSYILLGILPLLPAIVVLMVFYGVRGIATPLLKDLINNNCSSSTRATVLSIRNMIIRGAFALLGPFIGRISSASSLSLALVVSGTLLLLLSGMGMIFLFSQLEKEQEE